MKKKKNRKRAMMIAVIIIVVVSALLYFFLFLNSNLQTKIVEEIDNYEYTLEKRDTILMEENFLLLKDTLENKEVDYNKYAEYLSKLFVIDLFTLSNKSSKYDVGSVEYIYPDKKDSFISKVQDTLYAYLGSIDSLPEVKSISLEGNVEKTTLSYDEEVKDAYIVNLTWDYVEDFGYDNKAKITLIDIEDKLYIASYEVIS